MVITFPHMGKAYISIKALFDELGVDIIIPPPISKKTLEIGTKLSPEMACLPLKINMGNYIESMEKGADTIVLSGSCGPCRFGYYGVVQKEILWDLGYDVEVIILDPPKGDFVSFARTIKQVSANNSWTRIVSALKKAFKVTEEVEKLLQLSLKQRCKEIKRGETDRILNEFDIQIPKTKGANEILECILKTQRLLEKIEIQHGIEPIKIGLVGEIYTLIEPYVNLDIEKKLGYMGVDLYRGITLDSWVKDHLAPDFRHRAKEKKILKQGDSYLNLCVGGHAWQTIAHAVNYGRQKLDGVIQIMPFGCMPEIVAESILPVIAEKEEIPIMTLVVDEMTGEAGYQTRLEAFVDLLWLERSRKRHELEKILSWN